MQFFTVLMMFAVIHSFHGFCSCLRFLGSKDHGGPLYNIRQLVQLILNFDIELNFFYVDCSISFFEIHPILFELSETLDID